MRERYFHRRNAHAGGRRAPAMLSKGVCAGPEPILGPGCENAIAIATRRTPRIFFAFTKNKITPASRRWDGGVRYCYCHIDEPEGVVFEPGGLGVGTPPTFIVAAISTTGSRNRTPTPRGFT